MSDLFAVRAPCFFKLMPLGNPRSKVQAMRRLRDSALVGWLAVWVVAVSLGFDSASSAESADFYVSPQGNDQWSGTLATTTADGSDGPVATLEHARLLVRDLRAAEPKRKRPVIVSLRGGRYELEDTLWFSAYDSGTADSPTRYEAYQNEIPILSGGTLIDGWQVGADGRWRVTLDKVASGDWSFSQLFVNDQRRFRPVLPREGYYHVAESLEPSPAAGGRGFDRFQFSGGDLRPDWANLRDVEVLVFHEWNASRMRIESVDPEERIVRFTGTTAGTVPWIQFTKGHRYRVDNLKEALSEPGQWYLDRPTGELTYIPMPGETPQNTQVIAPRLDVLMKLAPSNLQSQRVEYLVFHGLKLAHSNWNLPAKGQSLCQAELGLSAAVEARVARNVRFESCTLRELGAHGIALRDGCQDDAITQCELVDLGAGGVLIGTTDDLEWRGRDGRKLPARVGEVLRNKVSDSTIAHGGRLHPAGVGVWVGHASYNVVTHNEIYDTYSTAISVGWFEKYSGNHNQITFNHIHTIGQKVLSDMGGVYTLGNSPGTVVANNLVHDVRSFDYGGWGLYTDEGSSDIVMKDNLVYRTKSGGFNQHFGSNNRIVNNMFVFGEQEQLQRIKKEGRPSFSIERNIVYWDNDSPLLDGPWQADDVKLDYNLYWRKGGDALQMLAGMSFDAWRRETGNDQHSLVADPMIVDPSAGDFHLHADSPAPQIGFVPFDYQLAGRETPPVFEGKLPPVPKAFD